MSFPPQEPLEGRGEGRDDLVLGKRVNLSASQLPSLVKVK